jgi:hypothetical protein
LRFAKTGRDGEIDVLPYGKIVRGAIDETSWLLEIMLLGGVLG